MKYTMLLFVLFFYLFSFQSTIYAAGSSSSGMDSVYDSIQKGEEKPSPSQTKVVTSQSSSLIPLFLKFIFSSALVIGLLVITLRFLSKRSRQWQSNGPIVPLGGHLVGNNRSVQVLLIGQTIYIIGVGETITLIRSISNGEEYQHLLESYENQGEGLSQKWLKKDSMNKWNSIFGKHLQKMKLENGKE